MTNRCGEPIEAILRPLMEATVWEHKDVEGFHVDQEGMPCPSCERRSVPDPHFDALRLPIIAIIASDHVSGSGIRWVQVNGQSWTIDASLGAIVRAAARCGRWEMQKVLAALLQWCDASQWDEKFLTPEEAAACALVAAWRDEKAASRPGGNAVKT